MGLLKKKESAIYLKIVEGNIAQQVHESTPDAVKIYNKEGTSCKHYLFFRDITGIIEKIDFREPPTEHPEYKSNWIIRIKNEEEVGILQIPFSSGYALSLFSMMPNINPEQPITISPSCKKENYNGVLKERRTLYISQAGKPLKWYYKKDNPGDMPPLSIYKRKGKIEYDDDERNDFFKLMCMDFNKKIRKTTPETEEPETEEPETEEPETEEPETEEKLYKDLPF